MSLRSILAGGLATLARWISPKAMPGPLAGSQWRGTTYTDAFKREREPGGNDLLAELKSTAFTCISINSAACANAPPTLYVTTQDNQAKARCPRKSLSPARQKFLRSQPHLRPLTKSAANIEEVTDHPVLDLFQKPNPFLGFFDLWELTTLYQEVLGSAYWYLDCDNPWGTPTALWLLPAQNVTPRREDDSPNIVDYYEYRTGKRAQNFSPEEIIHFRYPNPRDPYLSGLSPLRAVFEQVSVASDYAAFRKAKFENNAIPDALITPDEVMGEEERDRIEAQWNQRFRRGGMGKVVVADSSLKLQLLQHSMGDLAALAESNATKEDIVNAFHVPVPFVSENTNMANLIAARMLHSDHCIGPRLMRRDETLNAHLLPLYDPSGRLFFQSDPPGSSDPQILAMMREQNLKYGLRSINDLRGDDGLPPVPWGNVPWLPSHWAPTDVPRVGVAPGVARGNDGSSQDGGE